MKRLTILTLLCLQYLIALSETITPNEWYSNSTLAKPLGNTITVNPGDNLQNAIDNASGGDIIEINGGTYGPIAIENRSFSESNPLIIRAGSSTPTIERTSSNSGRTVSLKNTDYVVLDGLRINKGLWGIRANNSDHIIVINCEISNPGQEGIQSDDDADFWDIINTTVHHTGLRTPKFGEGIYIGGGSGGVTNIWIEGCELYECGGGEAINIKGNECRFVTVRDNYIHDVHPGTSDKFNGGAIAVDQINWADDGVFREIWIEDNLIEDIYGGATSNTAVMVQPVGVYIVNNTFKNCDDYGIWFNDFGGGGFTNVHFGNTFINNGQDIFHNRNANSSNTNPGTNPFSKQTWYNGGGQPPTPPQGNGGLPVVNFTASSDDGNIPENTYDDNLGTRWSAEGDGEWITHELDDTYQVESVDIAFFKGNERETSFDIQLSESGSNWTTVFSGNSSGNSNNFESFDFTDQQARFVRIVGHGNSVNNWNSLTEIRINGSEAQPVVPVSGVSVSPVSVSLEPGQTSQLVATVAPSNATDQSVSWQSSDVGVATVNVNGLVTAVASGTTNITVTTTDGNFVAASTITVNAPPQSGGLPITNATASSNDGNVPDNVHDGDLNTRWSANGNGQWLIVELDNTYLVESVGIAFFNGDQRSSSFDLALSVDGSQWTTVFSGNSSGTSLDLEGIDFSDQQAKFVRYTGYGNSANSWNSLTEVEVYGSAIQQVPVTGVSISPTALSLEEGESSQLSASVSPSNATNQSLTWGSSNTSVATVSASGLVTAIGTGSATITVTTTDGGFTATSSISVTSAPTPTGFRYLRFTTTNANNLKLLELDWLVGGTSVPAGNLSSNNSAGVSVSGSGNSLSYKAFDGQINNNGGLWIGSGSNLNHQITLDLGSGNAISPTAIQVHRFSWASLNGFRAEGSDDGSNWELLLEETSANSAFSNAGGDVRSATFTIGGAGSRMAAITPDIQKNDPFTVEIYPNPGAGNFNIHFNDDYDGNIGLTVRNQLGKEIITKELFEYQDFSLDLGALPDGLYLIEFQKGNIRLTKKIIIRR